MCSLLICFRKPGSQYTFSLVATTQWVEHSRAKMMVPFDGQGRSKETLL
jgi:hypothetical protein